MTKAEIVPLRSTGRTTRMLKAAIDAAGKHRLVYVIAAGPSHAMNLIDHLQKVCPPGSEPISSRPFVLKLPSGGKIRVDYETHDRQIDWQNIRIPDRDCPIFVDHYTIELTFGRLLEELHRWDEP